METEPADLFTEECVPSDCAIRTDSGYGIRYVAGGVPFGVGCALIGACPGPLFALLGSGVGTIAIALASALAGTWTYGLLRPRLPH